MNYMLAKGNVTVIRDGYRQHTGEELWKRIQNNEDL